jgi:hypothetical protein
MLGLDRTELLQNKHFRVLFIRGIYKNVSALYLFLIWIRPVHFIKFGSLQLKKHSLFRS